MPDFIGTTAAAQLASLPGGVHGVLRATVRIPAQWAPGYAVGALNWPTEVRKLIERTASSIAFPITGTPPVTSRDSVAVIDYRVGTHPGTARVGDLAALIESASAFTDLVRIESVGAVPALSAGGVDRIEADRAAELERARAQDAIGIKLRDFLSGIASGTVKTVAVVAVVGLAGLYLWGRRK